MKIKTQTQDDISWQLSPNNGVSCDIGKGSQRIKVLIIIRHPMTSYKENVIFFSFLTVKLTITI